MDAHLIARFGPGVVVMTMVLMRVAALVRSPVYRFADRIEQISGLSARVTLVVIGTALLSMGWLVVDSRSGYLPLSFVLNVRYFLLGLVLVDLLVRALTAPFRRSGRSLVAIVIPPKALEAFRRDWFDERDDLLAQGRGAAYIRITFMWRVAWELREVIRGLFIHLLVGIVRWLF